MYVYIYIYIYITCNTSGNTRRARHTISSLRYPLHPHFFGLFGVRGIGVGEREFEKCSMIPLKKNLEYIEEKISDFHIKMPFFIT